jgi:NAD(P)-dependent dehydrogenase (short-subunit alcohol dehydrogenase family)
MRAVLPIKRKQRSGLVINISSMAGVIGFAHGAAYAASKFAVESLSLSVAAEVEWFGIKVTLVEPGFFCTDLLDDRNSKYPATPSRTTRPTANPGTCGRPTMARNRATRTNSARPSSRSPMTTPPKPFFTRAATPSRGSITGL